MSFIDDDNVASYYFSTQEYVKPIPAAPSDGAAEDEVRQNLAGPRGNSLQFRIGASLNLKTSTFLFTQLGGEFSDADKTFYYIDTIVRVTGVTTGYKIDIPVRFVKCKTC